MTVLLHGYPFFITTPRDRRREGSCREKPGVNSEGVRARESNLNRLWKLLVYEPSLLGARGMTKSRKNQRRGELLAAMIACAIFSSGLSRPGYSASLAAFESSRPPSFAAIAKKTMPIVVNISTSAQRPARGGSNDPIEEFFNRFFGEAPPRESNQRSLGSGILISRDGEILTNYHVVRAADTIRVKLADGSEHEAGANGSSQIAPPPVTLRDIAAAGVPATCVVELAGDSSRQSRSAAGAAAPTTAMKSRSRIRVWSIDGASRAG